MRDAVRKNELEIRRVISEQPDTRSRLLALFTRLHRWYELQARPVTTLPRYTYPRLQGQPDYWSHANVKDALPMVQCTLNRRLVNNLFNNIITAPFQFANYPLLPGLQYCKFNNGRMYMNNSLIQWEFYDAFGITPGETNEAAGGYQPEISIVENEKDKMLQSTAHQKKQGTIPHGFPVLLIIYFLPSP